MVRMALTKKSLAILDNSEFHVPPVGVKFLAHRPDRVEGLSERIAFCEMLKRAQEGNRFFVDKANHACEAGVYVLGQVDPPNRTDQNLPEAYSFNWGLPRPSDSNPCPYLG